MHCVQYGASLFCLVQPLVMKLLHMPVSNYVKILLLEGSIIEQIFTWAPLLSGQLNLKYPLDDCFIWKRQTLQLQMLDDTHKHLGKSEIRPASMLWGHTLVRSCPDSTVFYILDSTEVILHLSFWC